MRIKTDTQIILTAEDGMYYTDGKSWGKNVILPIGADDSKWREISEADVPNNEEFIE